MLTGIAGLIMFILLTQYQDIVKNREALSAHAQTAAELYVRRDDYAVTLLDIRTRQLSQEAQSAAILKLLNEMNSRFLQQGARGE
jgi:hypothetical protein